jgi:hypothetical protein
MHHVEISKENKKLREPTNWFWDKSDGDFVSKVDDDCMLPDGWGATLRSALNENPAIGVIGCWRFYDEDFVPELAERKIVGLNGGHSMMRNCWVQGSGYVMRRRILDENGSLGPSESFPAYCIRSAVGGWKNGWYFPFIHEEHMDDPRSAYCGIKTDAEFLEQRPLSAINDDVRTLSEWADRVRYMARLVQEASPEARDHVGWRRKAKSLRGRVMAAMGRNEPWRRK